MGFDSVKDVDEKRQFNTGAVRDTQENKARYDLIAELPLLRLANHYANGAKKYDENNWRKGIPLSVFFASALRHLLAVKMGHTDEDHATAVSWNMFGFIHTQAMIALGKLSKDLDDLDQYTLAKEDLDCLKQLGLL